MTDLRLALMCGSDIPVPQCKVVIHQPKIKEIALIGETDFFVAIQCLTINKSLFPQDKRLLENTSNFQIFMTIMQEKEAKDKKEAVKSLFSILFPNYTLMLTPRSIILKGEVDISIDEEGFEVLQPIFKEVFCVSNQKNQQQNFNPANAKAKEIADKIMRGRQRVAEINGSAKASVFAQYLSILSVGMSTMSLSDLMNLTMYQMYDLIERYQLYVSWDIDIKSRLAGATPEDRPDNWMKNIH